MAPSAPGASPRTGRTEVVTPKPAGPAPTAPRQRSGSGTASWCCSASARRPAAQTPHCEPAWRSRATRQVCWSAPPPPPGQQWPHLASRRDDDARTRGVPAAGRRNGQPGCRRPAAGSDVHHVSDQHLHWRRRQPGDQARYRQRQEPPRALVPVSTRCGPATHVAGPPAGADRGSAPLAAPARHRVTRLVCRCRRGSCGLQHAGVGWGARVRPRRRGLLGFLELAA